MKYIYIFLTIVYLNTVFSKDYPLAPEKWSEPLRIDSVSIKYSWDEAPALTKNLDTMYLDGNDGIYMSVKLNGIWKRQVKLDKNVNDGTPIRYPSISKDGKRLYTTAYAGYGGWDIWYNDWDPDSMQWKKPKNMGPVINSPWTDYYLFEVSKDTVYVVTSRWVTDAPALFVWDTQNSEWMVADSFIHHPIGAGRFAGLSITGDKSKLYFSRRSFTWTDSIARGYELCVCYWDSTINNWGDPFFLNINTRGFQPDTSIMHRLGGYEAYPWISHDGKTLFFCSNRDAAIEDSVNMSDIYVSYLLVDEHGDTVTHIDNKNNLKETRFELHQNYPNPFNPSTTIEFDLPKTTNVTLKIFNILGEEVATLVSDRLSAGSYSYDWEASHFASGVYLYQLQAGEHIETRKMVLMH